MQIVRRYLVFFLAVGASRGLQAQSAQAFSIQASGLYNGVFGNAFTGLRGG